jgi:tRNA(fMet)-specific endonuclease VapC
VKYHLDTNAVARIFRREAGMLTRLLRAAPSEIFLSEVVFAEMSYGAMSLGATKRARTILGFIQTMRSEFQIAAWTPAVSEAFAAIKTSLDAEGARIEDFDIAIAAHALSANAVLVTSNIKHFNRVSGLRFEEWK